MSEAALAAKVVEWLQVHRWEVYQEVEVRGSVADIVCLQGAVVWVIECKKSLSLSVMGQAEKWTRLAHRVSVAVPPAPRSSGRGFAWLVLQRFRIGLLTVCEHGEVSSRWDCPVAEKLAAPLHRSAKTSWFTDALCEEHKSFAAAGTATGKRWTPFQATVQRVQRFVERNQGCSMKELVEGVDHHYASTASAKGSLVKWIEAGHVDGISIEYEGRRIRLRWAKA